jgi:ABC-2 type transport system ATP-binding protein
MDKTVLQTKSLKKRYGDFTAVEDLSLEIYEGEIFGFLGPNGAGKSTSINMMCGLLKPDEGSVLIQGKAINSGVMFSKVGLCPQSIILWSKLTCKEQLVHLGEVS